MYTLRERVWVRIDISISEWSIAIPKLSRQVVEPLETRIPAILMPEGHGERTWHNDLHTMKILCGMGLDTTALHTERGSWVKSSSSSERKRPRRVSKQEAMRLEKRSGS
jgi:hypothetical protein